MELVFKMLLKVQCILSMGDKNGNKIPDAEEIGIEPTKGDGDFRSEESIEL